MGRTQKSLCRIQELISLDQFAIAFTGKRRDLRYGTGSGSDLAPPGAATTEAPGRYRSLYHTAAVPYMHLQTAIVFPKCRIEGVKAKRPVCPTLAPPFPSF